MGVSLIHRARAKFAIVIETFNSVIFFKRLYQYNSKNNYPIFNDNVKFVSPNATDLMYGSVTRIVPLILSEFERPNLLLFPQKIVGFLLFLISLNSLSFLAIELCHRRLQIHFVFLILEPGYTERRYSAIRCTPRGSSRSSTRSSTRATPRHAT